MSIPRPRAPFALALAVTLASASPAHAGGIPVIDVVADIQRIKQVVEAIKTARAAVSMLETANDHYRAITGVRNMDDVMRLRLVRDIVPRDYRALYRCARNGRYECAGDQLIEIIEEHQIRDVCVDVANAARKASCQERAVKGAIDHSIALEAMESIEERNASIEALAARIATTTDPAELGKLQARIDAEALAIQNEALALDAARDASASYDRILAQRDREIEAEIWSSRRTPEVEPIAFGG